jgi:hypothetical protein
VAKEDSLKALEARLGEFLRRLRVAGSSFPSPVLISISIQLLNILEGRTISRDQTLTRSGHPTWIYRSSRIYDPSSPFLLVDCSEKIALIPYARDLGRRRRLVSIARRFVYSVPDCPSVYDYND